MATCAGLLRREPGNTQGKFKGLSRPNIVRRYNRKTRHKLPRMSAYRDFKTLVLCGFTASPSSSVRSVHLLGYSADTGSAVVLDEGIPAAPRHLAHVAGGRSGHAAHSGPPEDILHCRGHQHCRPHLRNQWRPRRFAAAAPLLPLRPCRLKRELCRCQSALKNHSLGLEHAGFGYSHLLDSLIGLRCDVNCFHVEADCVCLPDQAFHVRASLMDGSYH